MSVRGRVTAVVLASLFVVAALFFFLVPIQPVSTQCDTGPSYELCQVHNVTAFQFMAHLY